MKRIQLDSICSTLDLISELGLRPSVERRVKSDVFHHDISSVRELCMKNEGELLRIPSFNDVLISDLSATLAEYGLHFGMSEAELDAYMDRDYIATHGMPKSFSGAKSIEKVILASIAPPKTATHDNAAPVEVDKPVSSCPSEEVKEDPFDKTTYFAASFLGAMTGCMLIMFAKSLFTFILKLF